jgi:tripeptide aminopeptidase
MYTVKDRFLTYVKIDTQADPYSDSIPSTAKQIDLSKVLSKELTEMGITHELSKEGYIYASIPANSPKNNVPKIFFCSHVDTAHDASGTNVKPIVHKNYQGGDIVLPDDTAQVITEAKFPELKDKIGHDVITASGLTLLGADDKSGVACIMDAAYQLVNNPEIKHGEVKLFFTTDEEIGRGVKYADLDKIGADFGYTLDSGNIGNFEYENFSANGLEIKITGASAHPGYAKGKMESALKIASEIITRIPKDTLSPESTSGKEGFVHPYKVEGKMEEATLLFIIRDFETAKLAQHEALLKSITEEVLKDYPNSSFEITSTEQYRNMRDVIENNMHVVDYALEAMKNLNLPVNVGPIRGGTDGAVLSHKGLPCPNLFSGQHGIHSKLEWTTVQEMQAAVDTVVEICKITEQKA